MTVNRKKQPYNRRAWLHRWARRVMQSAPDRQDKMGSRYYPQAYEEYKRRQALQQQYATVSQASSVEIKPIKVSYWRRIWTQFKRDLEVLWIKITR